MEIVGNISKQKEDIDKVLKDTKELQKEINNLTGQLDRSFTIADELIFRVKCSFLSIVNMYS
jgi:iron uptake system EfeUOB component EfeO/EfeM